MPRIRCHYSDCVFIDDNYCAAAAVELDPETGCSTYNPNDDADLDDEDFDDELDGMEEEFEDDDIEDDDDYDD